MYIPGFNPYLENEFIRDRFTPMGVTRPAAQPVQQVRAPVSAPQNAPQNAPLMPSLPNDFMSQLANMPNLNPFTIGQAPGSSMPDQLQADLRIDPATGLPLNISRTAEFGGAFENQILSTSTPEGAKPGIYFTDFGGSSAIAGLGKDAERFTAFDPNATYRLVDEKTGAVITEGSGPDGMRSVKAAADQLNRDLGRKADWRVETVDPSSGAVNTVANADPRKSGFGSFLDALKTFAPMVLAATPLGPALAAKAGIAAKGSLAAKAVGAGLASGAGRTGVGLAAGENLGEALKAGALTGGVTGLTAGALGSLGAKKSALLNTEPVAAKTASVANAPMPVAKPPVVLPKPPIDTSSILVSGSKAAAVPALTGAKIGAVTGGALSNVADLARLDEVSLEDALAQQPAPQQPAPQQPAAPQQPQGALPGNEIVVSASGSPVANTGVANPFGTALPIPLLSSVAEAVQAAQQTQQQQEDEYGEIPVTAKRTALPDDFVTGMPPLSIPIPQVAPPVPSPPAQTTAPEEEPASEIVVSGSRADVPVASDLGVLSGLGTLSVADAVASAPSDGLGEAAPEKKKTLGDRLKDLSVSDYLKIAGLAAGLFGDKDGGRGNRGVIPAGLGSGFNPVFSGGLPAPTLPGASTGFAPRDPANIDYYRYGYGPEQSFFSYVPQAPENRSRAFTGYAEGGDVVGGLGMATESFAVNGPGTGRSDEIPAMLSDGEYVIDAETVALLGDGSSKAGADLLDQFRVNVRKDKGRKLARGEFSADAKRPEQYLKGGRA